LDRNSKIRRLYNIEATQNKVFSFADGTDNIILPRIKVEKRQIDTKYFYEMYNNSSDIGMPIEDWLIEFALDNGLVTLSNAMCYTFAVKKLEKTRRRKPKTDQEEERKQTEIENLTNKLKKLKLKNPINLNQIKHEYIKETTRATPGE
jgi:hypothetical protein